MAENLLRRRTRTWTSSDLFEKRSLSWIDVLKGFEPYSFGDAVSFSRLWWSQAFRIRNARIEGELNWEDELRLFSNKNQSFWECVQLFASNPQSERLGKTWRKVYRFVYLDRL